MYAFGILEHPSLGEANLIGGRKFRHAWSGSVSGTRRGVHVFFSNDQCPLAFCF
jgi:hypothetical protein